MVATKAEFLHKLGALVRAQEQALNARDMETMLALFAESERLFGALPIDDDAAVDPELRRAVSAAQERFRQGLVAWRGQLAKSGRTARLTANYGKSD
jgi:hypothetical protein